MILPILLLAVWAVLPAAAVAAGAKPDPGAPFAKPYPDPGASCQGVFFVYFLADQKIRFALSKDALHYTPLLNNSAVPDLDGDNVTSVRDPFLRWDAQSGLYRMVATDGYKFGHDATIWYWESKDLLTWTPQRALPVMDKYIGQFQDTWAPEWIWDRARAEYVVFWTTRWLPGKGADKFDPACTNDNPVRFAQWHTRTKDWRTFADPTVFIDMHCDTAAFTPMLLGDGGYDTDVWDSTEVDGLYRAYFKAMQAPALHVGPDPWNDANIQPWSGVHVVTSPDLKNWSLPSPRPKGLAPEFLGMWGAEGPEILVVNRSTIFLFFDCSFQPYDKRKWPKPPYGVATARYPDGFSDPGTFRTLPGSCTGNNTEVMNFPVGATQGSFICVSAEQYAAIAAKWPADG